MENWNKLVRRTARIEEIGARLDALTHRERVRAVRTMGAGTQRALWEMADGTTVTLESIVPSDVPPLTQVIHYGKSSLPLMPNLEKRFCRPSTGCNEDLLYGYNEGVARPLAGPGYFVVRETPNSAKGKTVIDYYGTPTEKPKSWPEIASTDWGVPALVFGFMNDYLRKVSAHVTISRGYKFHRATRSYILLCREPT